jgi:serine phosphatase RsbU (regulator of sigma subunit)
MKYFLILFCIFFTFNFVAQSNDESKKIAELEQKIKDTQNDSLKIELLNEINNFLNSTNFEKGIQINNQIIEIASKHSAKSEKEKNYFLASKSLAYNNKGVFYHENGRIHLALEQYKMGLEIDILLNRQDDIAASLLNIGSTYDNLGDYIQAINYYQLSLKIQKKIKNERGISDIYNNIGVVYNTLKQHDKALPYFLMSLDLDRKLKDEFAESITLSNIGTLYADQKKYDKALDYSQKAYVITQKLDNNIGQGMTSGNIGSYYLEVGDINAAEKYLKNAISIFRASNNSQNLADFLTYLARVKIKQNKHNEALETAREAYTLALESDDLSNKTNASELLYEIYKKADDSKNALKYFEIFENYKSQVQNDANKKQLLSFEFDKKIAEDSIKNREKIKVKNIELSLANKKNEQYKERIIYLVLGLLLLLAMIAFIFNRFQLIKKQKFTIEKQKVEVESQNTVIEEINNQLHSSISYAQMIQEAVLPAYDLSEMFEDSFLIYQPKDIVSGDFYWLERKNNKKYFGVADCTGHGIPGAFISMIGTILLNEIYNSKKITETHLMLNELSRLVQLTLMTKENKILNDGMDISMCVYDEVSKVVQFSGANNHFYVLSENDKLLVNDSFLDPKESANGCHIFKINADKKPIGKQAKNDEGFSQKDIQLQKNDALILMSDGFVDQFGGPESKKGGKKYKASQLESLLLKEYPNQTMQNIKQKLMESFSDWKGELEQVDDVCIIGIRV